MNARRHLVPGLMILAACSLLPGCSKKSTGDENTTGSSTPGEDVNSKGDFGSKPGEPTPAAPSGDANLGGDDVVGSAGWVENELQPVFFAFDRYDLTQASRDTLTRNARTLRDYPTYSIIIEGHCDERGTNEYNLALGDRRARAARDFLIAAGIDSGRFSLVSYGEEQPFVVGHDESAWSMNRRAHFKVKRGA